MCQRTGCNKTPEVGVKITIPCFQLKCDHEQSIVLGLELCRAHGLEAQNTVQEFITPEFGSLVNSLYQMQNTASNTGCIPEYSRAYITLLPLDCDEYKLFKKLRDSHEPGKQLH